MLYDIRRLDIYRKIPKDLTEPTYSGACISILSCLFIAFLFVSELTSFLTVEVISEMYVADRNIDDVNARIPVQLDITINMNCKYLGLDIQDDLGRHEVGFVENVEREPVNEGAACRLKARFKVNRVPGNFHVSTHSSREQPTNPDMSHVIHEIVFGDNISQHLALRGSFNPLADRASDKTVHQNTHDYILKVVPTIVEDVSGHTLLNPYQYTYAHRQYVQFGHGHSVVPAIWFRYDLSPITVRYIEKRKPFYSFLTTVCAIIGGTFTVAGIIDSLVFTAAGVFKKAQLGKLS